MYLFPSPDKIKCTYDHKISIQGLPWVLLINCGTPINRQPHGDCVCVILIRLAQVTMHANHLFICTFIYLFHFLLSVDLNWMETIYVTIT